MTLKAQLEPLRSYLREMQKERMELRSHNALKPADLNSVRLSNKVAELWKSLREEVKKDVYCYLPTELEQTQDEHNKRLAETPIPLQNNDDEDPLPPPEVINFEATSELPVSTYTSQFVQNLRPFFEPPDFSDLPPALPQANKLLLLRTLQAEKYLSENIANFGALGLSTLQKLRRVTEYLNEGNTGSAVRLLKVARASDPHNNALAYIFSQVEYFHVNHGHSNALPEARSEAHKSAALNEAVDGKTLLSFRYAALCGERACAQKKAIEWLQEFYVLDPEQTGGHDAFAKNEGLHLKSWLLLSTIQPNLWGDYVFNSIIGMTENTVGGAALYLHVLRNKVRQEMQSRSVPPVGLEELELRLATAYAAYLEIKNAADKWRDAGEQVPWTVRNRFLIDFLRQGEFPSFDEVLMNIALNGRTYDKHAFPTRGLMETGYEREQYWRLWAIALAPDNAQKNSNTLPFVEVALEKDFYRHCDQIIVALEEAEKELIDDLTWEEAHIYMAHLTMDHLLAASTRSDRPRSKFSPSVPPFNTYYREWSALVGTSQLPSVIIRQNASLGAFASSQEIMAAFEGATLLIYDPNYGIERQQELALEISNNKAKKSKWGGMNFGSNKKPGAEPEADLFQLVVYLFIPLLVTSFVVFFLIQLF